MTGKKPKKKTSVESYRSLTSVFAWLLLVPTPQLSLFVMRDIFKCLLWFPDPYSGFS